MSGIPSTYKQVSAVTTGGTVQMTQREARAWRDGFAAAAMFFAASIETHKINRAFMKGILAEHEAIRKII